MLEKKYFDKFLSYSKEDSEKYDMQYLPNFYFKQRTKEIQAENDVYTVMGDATRKELLEKIAMKLKEKNLKYSLNLIVEKNDINSVKINISKEKILLQEVLENYSKSRAILELVRERNIGTNTFRTIECLGLKRKLITNNKKILNEDFYNENNILVIDENNIEIPLSFISSPYEEISKEILEKYYIDNWINKLLQIQ